MFLEKNIPVCIVLYQISLNENVITAIRTYYTYWIVMKVVICNIHIMSCSMRICCQYGIAPDIRKRRRRTAPPIVIEFLPRMVIE